MTPGEKNARKALLIAAGVSRRLREAVKRCYINRGMTAEDTAESFGMFAGTLKNYLGFRYSRYRPDTVTLLTVVLGFRKDGWPMTLDWLLLGNGMKPWEGRL